MTTKEQAEIDRLRSEVAGLRETLSQIANKESWHGDTFVESWHPLDFARKSLQSTAETAKAFERKKLAEGMRRASSLVSSGCWGTGFSEERVRTAHEIEAEADRIERGE